MPGGPDDGLVGRVFESSMAITRSAASSRRVTPSSLGSTDPPGFRRVSEIPNRQKGLPGSQPILQRTNR